MSERRNYNKIIRLPVKSADERVHIDTKMESVTLQKQISRAIKDEKAELIDVSSSGDGKAYGLYRLDMNGQVTYIFDVRS